jgi:transposase
LGLDTSKHVFQVHGVDENGQAVLRRGELAKVFAKLPPTRIGIEACGASHHWARVLRGLGHEAVLMPPQYIKPYVKRGKNNSLTRSVAGKAPGGRGGVRASGAHHQHRRYAIVSTMRKRASPRIIRA